MKLIQTNKKGFGVHSPEIFLLITDVLFPNAEFYAYEKIRKNISGKTEQEIIQLIYNLLNSRQPKNILLCGTFPENEKDYYKEFSNNLIHFEELDNSCQKKSEIADFIVLNEVENIFELKLLSNTCKTICLKNMNQNEIMGIIFENANHDKNVQVTLKFKNFGIIIVDKKFQKQNYVIKSPNLLHI